MMTLGSELVVLKEVRHNKSGSEASTRRNDDTDLTGPVEFVYVCWGVTVTVENCMGSESP